MAIATTRQIKSNKINGPHSKILSTDWKILLGKGLSRRSLREHTIEALDVLVQIMLTDTHAFKRAIDMTDDELAAIVVKARLTVVK